MPANLSIQVSSETKADHFEALKASASGEWNTLDAAGAAQQIEKDLAGFSTSVARGKSKQIIKTHGLLDLSREFVEGMLKGGMDWGGPYGDMMHFDMRRTGVGKLVQQAKAM